MTFDPHELLATTRHGVLATIKANGLPQLSPVWQYYDRERGEILISTREGLVKTNNLRRDPRAAIEVDDPTGRSWATAEGKVTLTGPGASPDSPEVDALVDYYRRGAGEHPDWEEYREVMVKDRRVLITIAVTKVYGADIG
jgi:PPOX class probable F420-dependent enzyme